ncbi:MAG: LON peptidase substrate-binding domain-containing protein [Rhodospirillales bacterium]|jgi:Lon protease-like protein|nr:LON peptidase substrate-binding domain-containing protein [Rhodospirillales bacterium]
MSLDDAAAPDRRLPAILPVFPLDGVILLPRGHLPLQVFEPRYLNMIDEALGTGRVIGMIQPRLTQTHPIPDNAELFAVGCAGRIVSFAEGEDNRLLVTLRGLCRFRVGEELELYKGFRRVRPDYGPYLGDLGDSDPVGVDRPRLLASARSYLALKDISCDWNAVDNASDEALVLSFAMMCPLETREKQALLEAATTEQRAALLISLFEMAAHETDGPAPEAWH